MLRQVHDADLKLLRVFSVIARTGGFSAAQAELNTSQGFISTQMKSLEDRLGTRLCHRGHGGFKLTESGESVLRATKVLFEALESFRREVDTAVDPMLGEVRVGVIDQMVTSDDCAVARAIGEFGKIAPNASITLSIVPPVDLESRLIDDQLDMAYGIFHHHLSSLKYEPIGREEHEVYCGSEHPLFAVPEGEITSESIGDCEYVGWDYLETGEFLDSPLSSQLRAASPYLEAVLHHILSGRYIGYLPTHVGRIWVEKSQLRSLLKERFAREISVDLVTRRGIKLPALAEEFKAILHDAHQSNDGGG